jgi:D-alanyl-D-alanine carboxypeptidase (penicillin-binding protein 5/6)
VVAALALAALGTPAVAAGGAAPPLASNPLQPFQTTAAEALLVDADTQTVLFDKAADQRMSPASLAKLMTMAVVFDALKAGQLKLDDTFTVSENAWRKGGAPAGGTTMFAKLGSSIKVSDLIRGAIIQSANDACIVLAEGIAGSEEGFVGRMNAEAKKLGLTGSHFTNSTGLPDADQYVTARDLVTLARYLIQNFPDYYAIYSERSFSWNNIKQDSRNPLLASSPGADGLSLGGTVQTGFGLVGSANRNGERLIMVINGVASDKERAAEAQKLLDWGFRSFEKVTLFGPTEIVAQASVFGGEHATVGLVSAAGIDAFLPRGARDAVAGRVVYDGPVKAPVVKGQPIGNLEISVGNQVVREAPLYATEDVGVGSLTQRAYDGLRELLLGWWPLGAH